MRYAVISDIHSNLEALSAVLDGIAHLRIQRVFCLGDVVGYNANPNECVERVRDEGIHCIMGNHDSRSVGLEETDDFNPHAAEAVRWTQRRLSEENRELLKNLPRRIREDDFVLFHGSLDDPDRYILTRRDVMDNFRMLNGLPGSPRIGFFGHTHLRMAIALVGEAAIIENEDNVTIRADRSYLVNPGSVGQPRDGDPRASFCVYDGEERTIAFYRVEYDIRTCQKKVLEAGLPSWLAERLAAGR